MAILRRHDPAFDNCAGRNAAFRPRHDGLGRRRVFLGSSSLPSDPQARQHEQRGRRWFVLSFVLCPCHLPITLALLGTAFGGTVFGAALTGNALRVGLVMSAAYSLVLWQGFRQIRRAKRLEATGRELRCTPDGCTVTAISPDP